MLPQPESILGWSAGMIRHHLVRRFDQRLGLSSRDRRRDRRGVNEFLIRADDSPMEPPIVRGSLSFPIEPPGRAVIVMLL